MIFVDDVSRDRTREILREIVAAHPGWTCASSSTSEPGPRGDGDDGFRAARGEIAGYLDVDLEVHPRYVASLVRAIEKGADIATVQRVHALQPRSFDRYVMSRGYSFLVRRVLDLPFRDTETGYKFFRRARVLPLLDEVQDGRWFWDTEFMARAARRGLSVGRGARRLRAPRGQDLDGTGPARLGPLLPGSSCASAGSSRRSGR